MKYIASFVRKDLFYDFCLPELLSVCEMFKVPLKYDKNFSYDLKRDPLIEISYPNIDTDPSIAEKIINRAVLTKNIIKIISEGNTYEELINNVDKQAFLAEGESLESFRFDIDCRGRVMSLDEKLDIIQLFSIFNFKAKVDIKKAKRVFVVIDNNLTGAKYFGKLIAGKSDGKKI
jgi:tRNA G10  N-methylase Trm11